MFMKVFQTKIHYHHRFYIIFFFFFLMKLLKELVDVETQLAQKNSTIAGTYATSVALNIVGVLYTYHCCLLVSQEQTVAVFDGFVILLIYLLLAVLPGVAQDCNNILE